MAQGQFILFFQDTYGGRHPSKGTQYQIVNESGTEIARGITDDKGGTVPFLNSAQTAITALIKIKDLLTGRYEKPVIRVEDQATSQLQIEVLGQQVAGTKAGSLALLAFQRGRLTHSANHKPIVGAAYKGFMLDNNGKRVRARDTKSGQLIAGKTDAQGLTESVWCTDELSFEFTYPGTTVATTSAYLGS